MIDMNVQNVQQWFAENCERLSQSFFEVHLHVAQAADPVRGKIVIQVEGPAVGASITFWNKGDVEAVALDKINNKNHSFDDRVLTGSDDVSSLLESYLERLKVLEASGR